MSHAVRTLEPNQPKDNVAPTHTLWDNCCTRFEDTQFECGLRPLRPFGPGTRVARGSNVARGSSVGSLTNQEIMSHPYIHFGTSVARGSRTGGSNVAFGSLRPFGSNVARGSSVGSLTNLEIMSHLYINFGTIVTRGSRTSSSNVTFGSLRPLNCV